MNNKETKTTRAPYSNETFEIGKPYEFSDTEGFENPYLRLLIKYDVPKGTYETETLTGHRYTYGYIRKPDLSSETVKVVYDKYVNYAKEKYAVPIEEKKESFEIGKPYEFAYQANFYYATIRILIGKDEETGWYLTKNMTGGIYSYPYIRQAELNNPHKVYLYKKYKEYSENVTSNETVPIDEIKQISSESLHALANKQDEKPANIHKIDLPMVRRMLLFANGCTDKQLCDYVRYNIDKKLSKELKYLLNNKLKHSIAVALYSAKFGVAVIFIRDKTLDDPINSLVHESLHITFSIAEDIGLVYSADSEEFYTYLQTHIFRTCKQYL